MFHKMANNKNKLLSDASMMPTEALKSLRLMAAFIKPLTP